MIRVAPIELTLPATGARLAGLRAGPGPSTPGTPRVLALHGWLDNAASFIPRPAAFLARAALPPILTTSVPPWLFSIGVVAPLPYRDTAHAPHHS